MHIEHENKATLLLQNVVLFSQIFNRKKKKGVITSIIEKWIKAEMRRQIMKEGEISN